MKRNFLRKTVICILLLAIGFVWGARFGRSIPFFSSVTAKGDGLNLDKINYIYQAVVSRHVNPNIDVKGMEVGAIKGMLREVDGGKTRYETAEEFQRTYERSLKGEYTGIGVVVAMIDGYVVVVSPYEGTPADKAGVQSGDKVIGVDGKSVLGLSLSEVTEKIKAGSAGTTVNLTIVRQNEKDPLEVQVERANIEIPVTSEQMYDDIGYVRLTIFNQNSAEQVKESISKLLAQGAKACILDLRGNPGGDRNASIEVADLFLDKGLTVLKEVDREGNEEILQTNRPAYYELPMAVLIDGGSASSSEILTGALRDHGRATILGTTSFGKGTVQTGFRAGDGGILWITNRTYRTPAGENIDKKGIFPDVLIPGEDVDTSSWSLPKLEEYQLNEALKWIETNIINQQ